MKSWFIGVCFSVIGLATTTLRAAPGDQWILGIHHIDEFHGFTEHVGNGYNGPVSSGDARFLGNSYSHYGFAGDISRIYWELSGNSINNNNSPVPTYTALYKIEYWGVPQPSGRNDYQVIESRFHGAGHPQHGGEAFPYDDHIPWVGQFGTNHQWIRNATTNNVGAWNATGPGPQAPANADYNAPGNGIYMWLTAGSWLYVKWDFPFETYRAWSALRLTQFSGPPPLQGDYNSDGQVDAADYVLWRKNDIDGQAGYNTWRANFGAQAGTGSAVGFAVPEPVSLAILLTATLCTAACGRRRTNAICNGLQPRS